MPVSDGVIQADGEPAQGCGEDHSDRHGGAVAPGEALDLLDGMPQGVPVVEDLPATGLRRVSRNDIHLDLDRPFQQLTLMAQTRRVVIEQIENDRVGDEPRLHHLGQPRGALVGGQGRQCRQVTQHSQGVVERADKVLAGVDVDPGLAAERRIHHRQDSGRHLHDVDATQPGCGHEAGEVGRGSTTEADDDVITGETNLAQDVPAETRDAQLLGLLAVGDLDRVGLDLRRVPQIRDHGVRGRPQCPRMDHRGPGPPCHQLGEIAEQALPDYDLVGPHTGRSNLHPGHRCHRHGPTTNFSTNSTTSSGVRPAVSTTAVATSAYSGARARSIAVILVRGPSTSSGRSRARPTRATASLTLTSRWTTRCPRNDARVVASSTAPPPRASTPSCSVRARATASRSMARNASSPRSMKMSPTGIPAWRATSASVSRKAAPSRRASTCPTVVFPEPGGPTSTTTGRRPPPPSAAIIPAPT